MFQLALAPLHQPDRDREIEKNLRDRQLLLAADDAPARAPEPTTIPREVRRPVRVRPAAR